MVQKPLNTVLLFIPTLLIFLTSGFCQSELVETIYFKSNSYSIDKKYKRHLDLIATKLTLDTFGYLKIFGYTDTNGTANYNENLSEKRATAVYSYLAYRSKFDTTRVYVTWLGESEEAYDLHFPQAHIRQRCVDIWIQFRRTNIGDKPK